jgi:hypothetical protein
VIAASLTAPKLLKKSGEGYLLKPVFQPSQMVKGFSGRSKREHPFHFRAQRVQRDTVRVEGGEGFKLERAPADVTLASALGTYALSYKADGNNVLVTREMTLLPGRLSASEFPAFVDFCEKVDGAERESIIFRKVDGPRPGRELVVIRRARWKIPWTSTQRGATERTKSSRIRFTGVVEDPDVAERVELQAFSRRSPWSA